MEEYFTQSELQELLSIAKMEMAKLKSDPNTPSSMNYKMANAKKGTVRLSLQKRKGKNANAKTMMPKQIFGRKYLIYSDDEFFITADGITPSQQQGADRYSIAKMDIAQYV